VAARHRRNQKPVAQLQFAFSNSIGIQKQENETMKNLSKVLLVATSLALLSVGAASSQTAPSLNSEYKGTLVCAQLPGQIAVIRVPLDMVVTDNTVTFTRPILGNRNEVVGSEMAKGTVEDGKISLASTGSENGTRYEGRYTGAITADGGTFTGTQSWTMADVTRTRPCTGAFVKSRS
jgi:hypothetical protein